MFVRGRWVHWSAPLGRRVRSRLLGAFGCALGDVRFVQCDLVHWGAPWFSSGSLGISGFIGKRPGFRTVRSGSLGSLGSALGYVRFVRGRRIHWLGVVGLVRGHWVNFGGLLVSSGSAGVAGYIGMRPEGRRVGLWLLG